MKQTESERQRSRDREVIVCNERMDILLDISVVEFRMDFSSFWIRWCCCCSLSLEEKKNSTTQLLLVVATAALDASYFFFSFSSHTQSVVVMLLLLLPSTVVVVTIQSHIHTVHTCAASMCVFIMSLLRSISMYPLQRSRLQENNIFLPSQHVCVHVRSQLYSLTH